MERQACRGRFKVLMGIVVVDIGSTVVGWKGDGLAAVTICRSRELGCSGVCCREYRVMVIGCKMAQYIDILLITSAKW